MIFRKQKAGRAGGLYDAAVAQSRMPALYADLGAPDTIEGRFELLTLHVILIIEALRATGPAGEAPARPSSTPTAQTSTAPCAKWEWGT